MGKQELCGMPCLACLCTANMHTIPTITAVLKYWTKVYIIDSEKAIAISPFLLVPSKIILVDVNNFSFVSKYHTIPYSFGHCLPYPLTSVMVLFQFQFHIRVMGG